MNDHFLTLQTKVDTAGGSLQNPEMGPWLEVWGPAPTPLALDQRRWEPWGVMELTHIQESVKRVLLTHKMTLALIAGTTACLTLLPNKRLSSLPALPLKKGERRWGRQTGKWTLYHFKFSNCTEYSLFYLDNANDNVHSFLKVRWKPWW